MADAPAGRSLAARAGPAVAAGLALVAFAWTLGLPFQLDDYTVIRAAPGELEQLGAALTGGPASQPGGGYMFRPTMWAQFVVERELSGEVAAPLVFHLSSLLLHAVVTVLLWLLLQRAAGPGPALVGAAYFALQPAGAQAVSWVAARCDLLVAAFGVAGALAVLGVRGPRPGRAAILAGVLAAGATLSKSSGYVVAGVLVLAAVGLPRARGRPVPRLLGALVPVLTAVGLRWLVTGSPLPGYVGGARMTAEWLGRVLDPALAGDLLGQLLVPWNLAPEVGGRLPLVQRGLVALGVPPAAAPGRALLAFLPALAVGLACAPRRCARRLLAAAALLLPLALPPLFVWNERLGTSFGRVLYVLALPLAWALAEVAAAALRCRGPLRAALVTVAFLPPLLVALDAHVQFARIQLDAGRSVRARLESFERIAARHGADVQYVAVDPRSGVAGQPGLGVMIERAFAPPFHRSTLSVRFARNVAELLVTETLTRIEAPLLVAAVEEGRYVERTPVLPALPRRLPELVRGPDAPAGAARWRPAEPLAPRAAPVLRLRFDAGAPRHVRVVWRADEAAFAREVGVPASEEPTLAVLSVDDEPGYLLAAELRWVEVRGLEPRADPGVAAAELARRVPELTAVHPPPGGRVRLSEGPQFRVRGVRAGSRLELVVILDVVGAPVPLESTFAPGVWKDFGRGEAALLPMDGVPTTSNRPDVSWERLGEHFRGTLRTSGILQLPALWRVEARSPDGLALRGRTPWRAFLLSE